jgi:hypothetical protein
MMVGRLSGVGRYAIVFGRRRGGGGSSGLFHRRPGAHMQVPALAAHNHPAASLND